MSKGEKDYKVTLMKLQKQNLDYREELKALSSQLDKILQEPKILPDHQDNTLQIETLNKKISILESEIKKIRSKSPQPVDRFTLENTIKTHQESLRLTRNCIKDLQKQTNLQKTEEKQKDHSEKSYSELKTIRKKLKQAQEKYESGLKQHLSNQEEIKRMEDLLVKSQANRVDILKIESINNTKDLDMTDLKSNLVDLESQKRSQEQLFKQEQEKLQNEIQKLSENIAGLKKELKNKTHEVNSKEFEINNLKRKMRSSSAQRFTNSPDVGQYDEVLSGEKAEVKVLAMVKSETRIPSGAKKPPRPESNSPAAQRIKLLRSGLKPNI